MSAADQAELPVHEPIASYELAAAAPMDVETSAPPELESAAAKPGPPEPEEQAQLPGADVESDEKQPHPAAAEAASAADTEPSAPAAAPAVAAASSIDGAAPQDSSAHEPQFPARGKSARRGGRGRGRGGGRGGGGGSGGGGGGGGSSGSGGGTATAASAAGASNATVGRRAQRRHALYGGLNLESCSVYGPFNGGAFVTARNLGRTYVGAVLETQELEAAMAEGGCDGLVALLASRLAAELGPRLDCTFGVTPQRRAVKRERSLADAEAPAAAAAAATEGRRRTRQRGQAQAQEAAQERQPRRVIVVGAGIAGLSAAVELQRLGFEVVVVEARDRVGGRCSTEMWPPLDGDADRNEAAVDMGAAWVHGTEGNPLTELSKAAGARLVDTGEETGLFTADGAGEVPSELDKRIEEEYTEMMDEAKLRGEEAARRELEAHHALPGGAAAPLLLPPATGAVDWHDCALHLSLGDVLEDMLAQRQRGEAPVRWGRSAGDAAASAAEPSADGPLTAAAAVAAAAAAVAAAAVAGTASTDAFGAAAGADGDHGGDAAEKPQALDGGASVSGPADTTSSGDAPRFMEPLSPLGLRIMRWHFANIEYASGAPLRQLSLRYWDIDDDHAFDGEHCIIEGGYKTLAEHLALQVKDLRLSWPATAVLYQPYAQQPQRYGRQSRPAAAATAAAAARAQAGAAGSRQQRGADGPAAAAAGGGTVTRSAAAPAAHDTAAAVNTAQLDAGEVVIEAAVRDEEARAPAAEAAVDGAGMSSGAVNGGGGGSGAGAAAAAGDAKGDEAVGAAGKGGGGGGASLPNGAANGDSSHPPSPQLPAAPSAASPALTQSPPQQPALSPPPAPPLLPLLELPPGCNCAVAGGSDADGQQQVLSADAVIVTVPLGVLKAPGGLRFAPPLPPRKADAIARLGFGLLNKVALEFPARFWAGALKRGGKSFGHVSDAQGDAFLFTDLSDVCGGRAVLMALLSGAEAARAERETPARGIERCVAVLRGIFGEAQVPEPLHSSATQWGQDPWSRGSYSYVGRGCGWRDIQALSAHVECTVFFAGEATTPLHPASVHGAYLSGVREARQVHALFDPILRRQPDAFDATYDAAAAAAAAAIKKPVTCRLCDGGADAGLLEGPLVGPFLERGAGARSVEQRRAWVHEHCAAYSPEVSEEMGQWFNVVSAIWRGRRTKCVVCKRPGATIGCLNTRCPRVYHLRCAAMDGRGWQFQRDDQGKHFYCPSHRTAAQRAAVQRSAARSVLTAAPPSAADGSAEPADVKGAAAAEARDASGEGAAAAAAAAAAAGGGGVDAMVVDEGDEDEDIVSDDGVEVERSDDEDW